MKKIQLKDYAQTLIDPSIISMVRSHSYHFSDYLCVAYIEIFLKSEKFMLEYHLGEGDEKRQNHEIYRADLEKLKKAVK